MRWQTRFLQKFERVAIPNITLYWIAVQGICMLLIWAKADYAELLMIDTGKMLQGEWWRLVTFLFMPVSTSPIFAIFTMYFYWIMGMALEAHWGTARYNLFLLIGAVLNIGAAFLPALVGLSGTGTNWYLLESVFLGFAVLYPDYIIQIFFILPVKIKWLALITWVILALQLAFSAITLNFIGMGMIIASIGNFFLFFWPHILERVRHKHKVMVSKAKWMARSAPEPKAYMHRCVVCGVTERSNPQLEFRYCSTCGNKCYCLEHLRGHACTNEPALK
jgi:hypothetical protein